MRPRLRVLASALQASAASRLHRSPDRCSAPRGCRTTRAPSARTRRYRARRDAAFLGGRPGREGHLLRRPRQDVDVVAGLVRRRRRNAPASANPAWRRRRARRGGSRTACGRRRVGGVSATSPFFWRQAQGAPGRRATRAGQVGVARPPGASIAAPGAAAAVTRAARGRRAGAPEASRGPQREQRRTEVRSPMATTERGDGGGRRHLAYVP